MRYNLIFILFLFVFNCSQKQLDHKNLDDLYLTTTLDLLTQKEETTLAQLEAFSDKYKNTKYAQFSKLVLANHYFDNASGLFSEENFIKSRTNFKRFLLNNADQSIVPYIFYRLVLLDIKQNVDNVFHKNPNPQIYRNILNQTKKFILLYPQSAYLNEIKKVIGFTQFKLAQHNEKLADWYADKKLYNAATTRYEFILKEFPEYKNSKKITEKLIELFDQNNQTELHKTYKTIYNEIYLDETIPI